MCLSGEMDGGLNDLQVAASAAEKNAVLLKKSSTIFLKKSSTILIVKRMRGKC